jgi:hypothetical protein
MFLVEDLPQNQPRPNPGQRRRLLLGIFHGVPTTKKSIFDLPTGPDHIVLGEAGTAARRSTSSQFFTYFYPHLTHALFGSSMFPVGQIQVAARIRSSP